jgi:hypothetical protein
VLVIDAVVLPWAFDPLAKRVIRLAIDPSSG